MITVALCHPPSLQLLQALYIDEDSGEAQVVDGRDTADHLVRYAELAEAAVVIAEAAVVASRSVAGGGRREGGEEEGAGGGKGGGGGGRPLGHRGQCFSGGKP